MEAVGGADIFQQIFNLIQQESNVKIISAAVSDIQLSADDKKNDKFEIRFILQSK